MNKEQTLAAIGVMQAFVDGKEIERLHKDSKVWLPEISKDLAWDWCNHTYRIKRVPREYWLNVYDTDFPVAHESEERANQSANYRRKECIHVREVMPDDGSQS